MKVGDRIRMALRSFLQIEPANSQTFHIQEVLDWQGNAIKNRLWYRGDASELNDFYHQVGDRSTHMFWASVPTRGLEVRKIHTGLPKEIIETLSGLVVADMNDFDFPEAEKRDLWEDIAKENSLRTLVTRALNGCMVIGDGAFKVSLDPEVSQLPILEWVDGDRVEFEQRRGRVREVVFTSHYPGGYSLREHYGFGYVKYHLFHGETEVPVTALETTAHLQNVAFEDTFMLAVPFHIKESSKWPGRGQSFFEGKTDSFDALDEAWSQWVHAMRDVRPKTYIPSSLIPRDEDTGRLLRPNAFDNQFIAAGDNVAEGGKNEITVQQAEFYAEQYNATYMTALDLALQGLISPSTLGIDTKKLDNAEAQREKEKTTLYTRQNLIDALTDALRRLVDVTFKAYATMTGGTLEDTEVDISFGEYANPSFEAVVETLSNPNTPMSIQAKVDELWGDAKDETWKAEEVKRIKAEQGLVELEEPSVGTAWGGVNSEGQNRQEGVSDVLGGVPEATENGQ
ncbi:MAG: capsid protein [Clostridiales bacterium]|nr:capsid protein [Clostridiales bacterium]